MATQREHLLSLDALGKRYGRLPSEIVGISNSWAAYQFDRAVLVAGIDRENELYEKQGGKSGRRGKRPSDTVRKADGKFTRDKDAYQTNRLELQRLNGGKPIRKMKIPESGVW